MDECSNRRYDDGMSKTTKKQRQKTRKHGGGRQSLSGFGPTKIRSIKVPDEQWTRWEIAAEKAGVRVSEWLRRLADAAS